MTIINKKNKLFLNAASGLLGSFFIGLSGGVAEASDINKPEITSHSVNVLKQIKQQSHYNVTNTDISHIKDLNEIKNDILATPTGAFLKYAYGDQDLEKALKKAVHTMLKKIVKDGSSKHPIVSTTLINILNPAIKQKDDYQKNFIASNTIMNTLQTDFKKFEADVINLCREVLIKSVANKGYQTFYHGHNNSLRLYIDLLRELKSYEVINNLDETNPLRDKATNSTNNTVDEFLENYEERALDYADRNNLKLYDDKRNLGVGFAPDKIEAFRDNVLCVNMNLFGNMNMLAECTLFYWLDSFNISNPNEVLVKNLLKRILPNNLSDDEFDKRSTRYTDAYNEYMSKTGGNLMQIFVRNDVVDDIAFASWMKGIPVLLNKDTHTLATRGDNRKAIPVLTDHNHEYDRPSALSYINKFINDAEGFIDQYSDFSNKKHVSKRERLESYDRPQIRLVVDPKLFNDSEYVKVNQFTRFKPSPNDEQKYQQTIQNLIKEDIGMYLKEMQSGNKQGPSGDRLTQLMQFIEKGNQFLKGHYQDDINENL